MPYLYFDLGAAVLCASFMSFGVKRRWFALGAALQLAISTYAAYIGGYVHYGDWLKVSTSAQGGTSLGGWGARGQCPVTLGQLVMHGASQVHSVKPGKAEPLGLWRLLQTAKMKGPQRPHRPHKTVFQGVKTEVQR